MRILGFRVRVSVKRVTARVIVMPIGSGSGVWTTRITSALISTMSALGTTTLFLLRTLRNLLTVLGLLKHGLGVRGRHSHSHRTRLLRL
jgi:hypothetical protein